MQPSLFHHLELVAAENAAVREYKTNQSAAL